MSRLFVTSLPTSPLCILLPLGLLAFPPTFPISQTSMDLVAQLVVLLNFFTPRPHYMSRLFVTSLPTLPLCILLPLGLHTSPPTFPIPQTSSDLAKIGLCFCFALPAGMLLQSETKIEPDLRLFPIQNALLYFWFFIIYILLVQWWSSHIWLVNC